MKNNRILCLLLSFIITISSIAALPFAVVAADDYTNEYSLLNALGVFNGENTPQAAVTRKELAVYVQKITKAASGDTSFFYDVDSAMPEASAIQAMAQSGYMNGSDGCFYPDRGLTYKEAMTTLLRVAGYKEPADQKGGYWAGYVKWAVDTGLNDNIQTHDGTLTQGELSRLLYNFMDVSIVVATGYDKSGATTLEVDHARNILIEYFDIIKWEGAVVATPNASIWNYSVCKDDKIIVTDGVDEFYYNTNGVDYDTKLGIDATFYFKKGTNDIVCAEYDYANCNQITFSGDDIHAIDRSLFYISYYAENKVKTLNTSSAKFVYNGKANNKILKEEVKSDFSVVECRDVNKDKKIDIVYVWDYDVIMVDYITFSNYKIMDKITGESIDFDPDMYDVVATMDGGDYDVSDIKQYDTVLVARSKEQKGEKTKLTFKVFPDSVEGKVTAIDDGLTIEIAGELFNVRSSFYKTYSPKMGEEYIVGIDFEGNALCMTPKTMRPQKYGFAMGLISEDGFDTTIKIRMFTENNKFEVFTFAKKFRLNGEPDPADYDELTKPGIGLFDSSKNFVEQLVSYRTNDAGLITDIYVTKKEKGSDGEYAPVAKDPVEGANPTLTFNRAFNTDTADNSNYFNIYDNAGLNSTEYIAVDTVTKNFLIMKDGDKYLEDQFLVGTATQMGVREGYFDIKIYDASYERIAGAAVYTVTTDVLASGDSDVYGFVVSSVSRTLNDEGVEVRKISGVWQGKEMSFVETDTIDFSKVRPGDVLVTWNGDVRLVAYKTMFSLDETTLDNEYMGYDCDSDEFWILSKRNIIQCRVSGFLREVVSKSTEDGYVYLTKTRESGELRPLKVASYTNYYIYDTDTNKITIGTQADLDNTCKNVYFVATYGVARDVIIYK